MRRYVMVGLLMAAACPAWAQTASVRPDLPALIECRQRIGDFSALAPILADPLKAVALGWAPQAQSNLFMTEYTLNTPITVFGHSTSHIAFPVPASWRCSTCPTRARWQAAGPGAGCG